MVAVMGVFFLKRVFVVLGIRCSDSDLRPMLLVVVVVVVVVVMFSVKVLPTVTAIVCSV